VPNASWAIALVATRSALPFLLNALIGIQRCGIDPAIVTVGAPEGQIEPIRRMAESFGAKAVELTDEDADQPVGELFVYGSTPFDRFTAHKYPLTRALLAERRHVVYADVDVAWLRNPLPYLERVLAHYCCAVQTEAVELFPPLPICSGFLAFAPTPAALRMLGTQIDILAATVAAGGRAGDQDMLRSVVMSDPQFLHGTFPLPECLFPNGRMEGVFADYQRQQELADEGGPFVFHANWTEGFQNKRAMLERVGGWFVKEVQRPG